MTGYKNNQQHQLQNKSVSYVLLWKDVNNLKSAKITLETYQLATSRRACLILEKSDTSNDSPTDLPKSVLFPTNFLPFFAKNIM